jgi:hypothetical protein
LKHVTFNDNGFYNEEDLDDGFDTRSSTRIPSKSIAPMPLSLKLESEILSSMPIAEPISPSSNYGLELDEAGRGSVDATLKHVTFNDNGFYNEEDFDDGFDIDERGTGDIDVSLFTVLLNRNQDEGFSI